MRRVMLKCKDGGKEVGLKETPCLLFCGFAFTTNPTCRVKLQPFQ